MLEVIAQPPALVDHPLTSDFIENPGRCSCPSLKDNPTLPPIFYSQCFPFTLALRVTANIVFLVLYKDVMSVHTQNAAA